MSKISKLGLGIVAFEGIEHIKNITYELRNLVDVIVVCLQKESYHGEPIQQDDIDGTQELLNYGYIDDIIWFEVEDKHEDAGPAGPRLIETDKRNFILNYLEEHGCSHALITDSDEFYDKDDFKYAKNFINRNENVKITYCQYINYYRDYSHVLVWPFLSYVPFISEISFRFEFNSTCFKKASDPTRRYFTPNGEQITELPFTYVKMHHLSWIRLDITKKIANWSAKKYFNVSNLEKAVLHRYFNYKDGQNAIITFNVPNYEVCVNKLNKMYIHPRFKLDDPLIALK